jgi:hypothetical protein
MIYAGMALCINGKTMKYVYNISYEEALYNACINAGLCNDWSWMFGSFDSYFDKSIIPRKWYKLLTNQSFDDYPILKCIIKYNKFNNKFSLYGCLSYKILNEKFFHVKNWKPYTFEEVIKKINDYYIYYKKQLNINKLCLHNLQGFNSLEKIEKIESISSSEDYYIYNYIKNKPIPELFSKLLDKDYIFTGIIISNTLHFTLISEEKMNVMLKDGITVIFPYGENTELGVICIGDYEHLNRIGTFIGNTNSINCIDIWKINII